LVVLAVEFPHAYGLWIQNFSLDYLEFLIFALFQSKLCQRFGEDFVACCLAATCWPDHHYAKPDVKSVKKLDNLELEHLYKLKL